MDKYSVEIELSQATIDRYAKLAKEFGTTVEKEIEVQLETDTILYSQGGTND